ncbi:Protein archease [subsurface metagenome]
MSKRFEVIEHTADVCIAAYGSDVKEAFANAAYALFSLMIDLKHVSDNLDREVEVTAENQQDLLVAWLNELIYLFEVEGILFKRFRIDELTETKLKSRCYGEKVDPVRHKIRVGVKAATYHMLKVEKNNGFRVQVLFDI